MSVWFSIEVFDGASSAALWAEAFADGLAEAALLHGALDWSWHRHSWGAVFEVSFDSDEVWESYQQLPNVRAALEAVPDPFTGLIVYRGRGGSAATGVTRRPRPLSGSGAAALPLPWDLGLDEIGTVWSLLGRAAVPLGATANRLD